MTRLVVRVALIVCFACTGTMYGADTAASPPGAARLGELISAPWETLSKLWQKASSMLAPNDATSTATTDAGSDLDPFGKP